jgi:hypothetical protein
MIRTADSDINVIDNESKQRTPQQIDRKMDGNAHDIEAVREIAQEVANSIFRPTEVSRDPPLVFMTTDGEGNDAWDITFTLMSESAADEMPEGAALKALVQIHDRLLEGGDDRFRSFTTPPWMNLTPLRTMNPDHSRSGGI